LKIYNWNIEKNLKLKKERNITFEEVVFSLSNGELLDIIKHPNKEKYNNQFVYIVNINNYAYFVPFVENKSEIFLKTIFPSRKATKKYLN
jgi:hypothetical protein